MGHYMMKQYIKYFFLTCFLGLMTTHSWAASVDEAQAIIKETTDKMLAALQAEKENLKKNPERVYTLVDKIVLPHFDFERMSKLVLAQNWKQATADQKTRFTQAFRDLLVRTYATALVEAAVEGVEVVYKQIHAEGNAERITLNTEVKQGNQKPISVDYAMYFYDNHWKVYNVTVGGVSLVTNYRNEFANDIKTIKMEGLIDKIAHKKEEVEETKK
jgi:phospholipid transport system substrate-binding protein